MKVLISCLALLFTSVLSAQLNTDVYLFKLTEKSLSAPINISDNEGYDNQPAFWEDSKSVLYARRVNGQTEIARYFIDTKETKIITNTPQGGEYSPTQIPGTSSISSIRLDTTGLQLLYKYDLNGEYSVLVNDLKIGYHAWVDENTIIAFVLGEPATFQVVDLKKQKGKKIGENIGRSLHRFPTSALRLVAYVDKSVTPHEVMALDIDGKDPRPLMTLPEGSEDICIGVTDRAVYSSRGTEIVWLSPGSGEWEVVSDLKNFGLTGKISRLSVSPDNQWMAVAVDKE